MKDKKIYDIVGKRKIFFTIPIVVFVVTIVFLIIAGLEVDIEFKGGTLLTYSYTGEIDTREVASTVEALNLGTVNVTTGSAFNSELETVSVSFASNAGLTADVQNNVSDTLVAAFKDNNLSLVNSQDVNPSTGSTFFLKCLVAVLFSFVLLVIYIALRFKKIGGLSAGMFALVALMHDIFLVFAVFVFFRFPIDANFMAVILTILGYSINNTIVVYDRVRENRNLYGKKIGFKDLVNQSVSQTLSRSINTTITTGAAVLVICIVCAICGVESIISFAFPLLVGLLAGTYSSILLAGPLWVLWQEYKEKKGIGKKKIAPKKAA